MIPPFERRTFYPWLPPKEKYLYPEGSVYLSITRIGRHAGKANDRKQICGCGKAQGLFERPFPWADLWGQGQSSYFFSAALGSWEYSELILIHSFDVGGFSWRHQRFWHLFVSHDSFLLCLPYGTRALTCATKDEINSCTESAAKAGWAHAEENLPAWCSAYSSWHKWLENLQEERFRQLGWKHGISPRIEDVDKSISVHGFVTHDCLFSFTTKISCLLFLYFVLFVAMISTAPPQIIDGHYVDPRKLISLLQRVYGTVDGNNNFRVEVKSIVYFFSWWELISLFLVEIKSLQDIWSFWWW